MKAQKSNTKRKPPTLKQFADACEALGFTKSPVTVSRSVVRAVSKASKARAAIDKHCARKRTRKGDDDRLAKLCEAEVRALRKLLKLKPISVADVQLITGWAAQLVTAGDVLPECWDGGTFLEQLTVAVARWLSELQSHA